MVAVAAAAVAAALVVALLGARGDSRVVPGMGPGDGARVEQGDAAAPHGGAGLSLMVYTTMARAREGPGIGHSRAPGGGRRGRVTWGAPWGRVATDWGNDQM